MHLDKSTIQEVKRASMKNHKQLASMLGLREDKMIKCPFHNDHTPSAKVGEWGLKCFSRCGCNYDWIEVYKRLNNVSFIESVLQLADFCGVIIDDDNIIDNYNVFNRKASQKQMAERFMPISFSDLELIGLDGNDNAFCPVKCIEGEFHILAKNEAKEKELSLKIDKTGDYILGTTPYYSMRDLWNDDKKMWFDIVSSKTVETYKYYHFLKEDALSDNNTVLYYDIEKKIKQLENIIDAIISCQNIINAA